MTNKIENKIDEMNSWIDLQINLIRGHKKPIYLGSDEWNQIIDKAMKIEQEAYEKFDLFDYFVNTKQSQNGEIYYENTEEGSSLYYSIEDRLMNKFCILEEVE